MLTISSISKAYGAQPVLRGISLELRKGETVALLGPSGCGKTTLLRIVAGLEDADNGRLRFGGEAIDRVAAHERGFGLMFQEYALFPHLSVAENVAYGLHMRDMPAAQIQARVAEMLELVGLSGHKARRVFQLSGGERQRVALARTLAPQPRLLLLDEPLAALDRTLRERLQHELASILRHIGVTTIYVTHDQEEAFALADRVALLNAGALVQFDTPETIYRRPANAWVARFQGLENVLSGAVLNDGSVQTEIGVLSNMHQRDESQEQSSEQQPATLQLVIYPDAARLVCGDDVSENPITAVIAAKRFRGRFYQVEVAVDRTTLTFEFDTDPGAIGASLLLWLDPQRITVVSPS
jgi:ABC-type Fe3+/spermidine/putrescine transport system ATPase subunit